MSCTRACEDVIMVDKDVLLPNHKKSRNLQYIFDFKTMCFEAVIPIYEENYASISGSHRQYCNFSLNRLWHKWRSLSWATLVWPAVLYRAQNKINQYCNVSKVALLQCIYQLVQVQQHNCEVTILLTLFHWIHFNFTDVHISNFIWKTELWLSIQK